MTTLDAVREQRIILYDDFDGLAHVYDTAYCDTQERDAIVRCVNRYGKRAKVRSVASKLYPPRHS